MFVSILLEILVWPSLHVVARRRMKAVSTLLEILADTGATKRSRHGAVSILLEILGRVSYRNGYQALYACLSFNPS